VGSIFGKTALVVVAFAVGLALSLWLEGIGPAADAGPAFDSAVGRRAPEKECKRIICMSPAVSEIVFAIGGGPHVVGVSQHTTWPPEALRKPKCGGFFNPSFERILSLNPDLIVAQGKAADLSAFAAANDVELLSVALTDLESIFTATRRIGRAVGLEPGAELVCAGMRYRLAKVRARVVDRRQVPMLLVIGRQAGSLTGLATAGEGTFLHDLIEAAGGVNVFGDMGRRYGVVNKETLVQRAPEVIVELHGEGHDPEEGLAEARRLWSGMKSLPAVRRERIHVIESTYAMIPGPRVVDLADRLADILHGEAGHD